MLLVGLNQRSVALTRTGVAPPAVAVGVPVRPVVVPGAALSPGRRASRRLKGPAETTIAPEIAGVSAPLENRMVLVAAPAQARLVKVATPLTDVILVVPSNSPVPVLMEALTTSAS